MSALKYGALSFPAFSGLGDQINRREYACHIDIGPIPPGSYYLLDRQSGGLGGFARDAWNRLWGSDRSEWFALYANDGKIDDITYCNEVQRGSFRLHPKGPLGISKGCITIETRTDFQQLSALLKNSAQICIPGTDMKSYAKVIVE